MTAASSTDLVATIESVLGEMEYRSGFNLVRHGSHWYLGTLEVAIETNRHGTWVTISQGGNRTHMPADAMSALELSNWIKNIPLDDTLSIV